MVILLFLVVFSVALADQAAPRQGNLCGSNVTLVPAADVSVNKAGPSQMVIGFELPYTYQVNVANAGPNNSFAVVMRDLVPCDVRVTGTPTWQYNFGTVQCTVAPNTNCANAPMNNVTCNIPILYAGNTTAIFINVTVPSNSIANSNLANTATVSATTCDNDLTNNQNTALTPLIAAADNYVFIQGDAFATAGQAGTVSQTVTVQNLGSSDSPTTWTTFIIPPELAFSSVKTLGGQSLLCGAVAAGQPCCVVTGNLVNCTIGLLTAKGPSFQYVVESTVPSGTCVSNGGCSLTFQANVDSLTFDPNLANNVAFSKIEIRIDSNVGVTKSGPSGVWAGAATPTNPEFYTIVIENAGPSDALNVLLTDQIPPVITPYGTVLNKRTVAALDEITASCSTGNVAVDCNITCWYAATRYLICTLSELTVDSSATIIVPFGVAADMLPQLVNNTAVVSSGTLDSDLSRNQDSHIFPIFTRADPYIDKTGPQGVIIADTQDEFTYTFTVGNLNISTARSVVVTDTLDSKLELISVSIAPLCNISGNSFTCNLGDIDPGEIIQFTAKFRVKPGFLGVQAVVPNCVYLTSNTQITPDVNLANNQDCTQFTLYQAPDVSVFKIAPGPITVTNVSQRYYYTIEVVNLGPVATAQNVRVTDTIPNFPQFTVPQNAVVIPTIYQNPGNEVRSFAQCLINGNFIQCDIGTMVVNFAVRILVPFDVAPTATAGTFPNTAYVSHTTPDTNSTNNQYTVPTIVIRIADVKITKQGPVEEVCAGDGFHWFTITVQNLGPADAQAVSFSDPINSVFTLGNPLVYDASREGVVCSTVGQTVTCSLGGIPAGGSVVVRIQFRVLASVPASVGVLNNVTVTSLYDPNPDNDWSAINQPICVRAPLTLTKEVSSPTVTAGANNVYTYTLTGRNPNGPSDAVDVVLTDTIPAEWTNVAFSGPCTYNTTTRLLRCTWARLTPGATVTVLVFFQVPNNVSPRVVENCALFYSSTPPNTITNPVQACVNVTVINNADLSITKTGPSCPIAGTSGHTYFITVRNMNGPSRAENVIVTDTLPTGINPVTPNPWVVTGAETGWSCSWTGVGGRSLLCSLGGLNPGAIVIIQVPFSVAATAVPFQSVTNTAVVSSSRDNVPGNNQFSFQHNICNLVDLEITKEGPVSLAAGSPSTFEYRLIVKNNGPSDAVNAVVTDDIPIDFEVTGSPQPSQFCRYENIVPATATAKTRLVCEFPVVHAGETLPTIRVFFTVAASVVPGPRVNCAYVDNTASQTDSNPSNNVDCITTTVDVEADLHVLKTGPERICAGFGGRFQIFVSNGGPAIANNVQAVDRLPAQFTPVGTTATITPNNATGLSCNFALEAGLWVLRCNLLTMAPNTAYTITYDVTVANTWPAFPFGVNNTVVVSSTTADGTETNNESTHKTEICANSLFTVFKKGPATPIVAGSGNYLYTLQVTNNGPAAAQGVTVTDTLPNQLTPIAVVNKGTATTCGFQGQLLTCVWESTFPVGAFTEIIFSFSVKFDSPIGTVTNCFQVRSDTAPGGPFEDCEDTPVTTRADVAIFKSGPSALCAGDPEGTFVLTVVNANGPSVARGVFVQDALPDGLSPSTAVPTVDNVPRADLCRYTGTVFTCNLPDMNPGVSHVIRFKFAVLSSVTARNVTNVAQVFVTTQDDNSANNQASWPVQINNCANFGILKTAPSTSVTAGDPTEQVFVLTARNDGPSDARNVVVTDQSLLESNVNIIRTEGASCSIEDIGVVPAAKRIVCTVGYLPAGSTVTIRIYWNSPASANPGTYTNCALITSNTPHFGNNPTEWCVPFTINASARLVTVKEGVTPIVAGENLANQQFSIRVTNVGGSDARQVTFTDNVNPIFQVTSAVPSVGTCQPVVNNNVQCSFGTLIPGASVVIIIKYTTLPDAPLGTVPNTACVATTTPQSDSSQNCDDFDTVVICRAPLTVTKTVDIANIEAGSNVIGTFTITITNNGPSTSKSTSITDIWPAGLTRVGVPQVSQGGPCADTANGFFCNIGTLAPGASATVTQQFRVLSGEQRSVVTNNVCGSNSCSNAQYCAQRSVVISRGSDLCVSKTNGVDVVEAGKFYTYTIGVTNNGPSDASGVTIIDTWPSVLVDREITAPGWVCSEAAAVFSCVRDEPLVAGQSDFILVRYRVLASVAPGYITNCVVVTFSGTDTDTSNNEACDTDRVINFADLEIIKTIDNEVCPVAGSADQRTYFLTVKNLGPTIARNVRVFERFPPELTLIAYDTQRCSETPVGSHNYTCLLGDMAPGASTVLSFTFIVDACVPAGIIENWANVTSDTADPDLCNNVATLCTPICVASDLSITKTDNVLVVTAGDEVTYTYTICAHNAGPSCAAAVDIFDVWPFAQWGSRGNVTAPGWTCTWDASNNLRCSKTGGLEAGQTSCLQVSYHVPACLEAGQVCNTVTISSPNSPDPNGSNNVAIDCNQVRTEADVIICKSDGVVSVVAGDGITYTYTIDVCNNGPSCAKDVRVLDHFPPEVIRVGPAVPSQGSCINTDDGNDFACNLITLQPGQCVNITASYKVPSNASTCSVTNVAVVSSVTFDPELCNNDAKDVNALLENSTLTISKTGPGSIASTNRQPHTYTITITNTGPSIARDVVITDRWPAQILQYLDATTGVAIVATRNAACVTTGGDFSCAAGDLPIGASVQVTVHFTLKPNVPCGTVITNRATVFSPTDTECRDAEAQTTVTCVSNTQRCINCVQFHALSPTGSCYAQASACLSGSQGAACKKCIDDISVDPIRPPTECFLDSAACSMMQCIYNDACGLGTQNAEEFRECDSPFTEPIVCARKRDTLSQVRNVPAVMSEGTTKAAKTEAPVSGAVLNLQRIEVKAELKSATTLDIKFKNPLKMKVQIQKVELELATAAGDRSISLIETGASVKSTTCKSSMKLRKDWTWSCQVELDPRFMAELVQATTVNAVASGKAVVPGGYHPVVGVGAVFGEKKTTKK